ncbi:MAG: hypothetical protein ACK5RO_09835 [Pseudobdellovibrionaceae bacterium]
MAACPVARNRSSGQSTLEAAFSLFVLLTFFILLLRITSLSWTRWMMEIYGYRWVKCEMSLTLKNEKPDCERKYRSSLEQVLPFARIKDVRMESTLHRHKKLKVRMKPWGLNEATFSQTIKIDF